MTLSILFALAQPVLAAEFRTVGDVLAEFDNEPAVLEVQKMVLEYSKTDPRYIDAWLKASQSANALPKLGFTYDYDDKFNAKYTYYDDDREEWIDVTQSDADIDNDHGFQVKAEWHLEKLIMSSERIRLISETQDIVKLRDKVLEEATRVYFDRRRLQVETLLGGEGDIKARMKNELRLQELTAQLDAFTGGRFTSSIRK